MARRSPPPPLGRAQLASLKAQLDALVASTDPASRLSQDPLRFVRQWPDPADAEVAAVFASGLAFGRVSAFGPVIGAIMDQARVRGGPRAWIDGFDRRDAQALAPVAYRWLRGPDFALLALALQSVLAGGRRLEALAVAGWDGDPTPGGAASVVSGLVQPLRAGAVAVAPTIGVTAPTFRDLPRGLRYLLPDPSGGSACKRWCMFLRWLVRPSGPDSTGVDLGLWGLPASLVVVPLDTHVHRIARYIGLTHRADASWRTAVEVTRSLARLDPADPARYDFALAHLGISGACRGAWDSDICTQCALFRACTIAAGRPQASPPPSSPPPAAD